jgi:hypothetical protein
VAIGFDPNLLLNYFAAKLPLAPAAAARANASTALPPWDISIKKPAQEIQDVSARSSTAYFDPKDRTLLSSQTTTANAGSQIEALLASRLSKPSDGNNKFAADNDRLFALYSALDRLDYIAKMANRDGAVDGQRPGLNKDFQNGLTQVLGFIQKAPFDNLTMLPGQKTASAQTDVAIAYPKSNYTGGTVTGDSKVFDAVPGVSASDKFTISITKAGVSTDVPIDLANVAGTLNLDNIDAYVNQQLTAAGFATRFSRVQTGGAIADRTATWGLEIQNRPGETVTLSSDLAKPAIYLAGAAGKATDSQGKLIKLVGLDGTPASAFAAKIAPDSGTASAKATAVDADGNVYVVGNASGSFGSEVNQASQDVYLSKYDSAGNVQWTILLGAADTASGFGLAVDSVNGGVVISGSVKGDLTPSAIGDNSDSFVAKYDASGNQKWLRQVAPASDDSANSVAVDSSGNVFVGGQVTGAIAAGQTSAGGQDAYVTKLDSKGALLFNHQFGTTGSDAAVATAVAGDGNLIVASQQNGHAILTKYAGADSTSAAMWQVDLGDLQGGSIGGLTISGGKVYLAGTTANGALTAGGAASVANASSGGTEAFVFSATDNGASATPDFVSYVGTGAAETGGGVAVTNGKIYLTGTTTGTFAGQSRSVSDTHNMFVAQLSTAGALDWAQQYGGLDGESRGLAIAADPSGASVLDALKLARGKIDNNQSNAVESQTSARAGDYFTLQIEDKTGTRNVKITIAKGETMRSLALKINGALLFDGKATALPVKGGQALKIAVSEGVKVKLVAGAKDFDALAGLGLKPQLLTNDGKSGTAASTNSGPQTIGLGIDGGINLLDKQAAAHAHVVILGAMAQIKLAYNTLNAPPSTKSLAQNAANAPAYLQTQLGSYQTALAWFNSLPQ